MSIALVPFWIVNITPDSFSDGGVWEKNPEQLLKVLKDLPDSYYFDIGAESTAPGRSLVSSEEEIARLELFFDNIVSNIKKKLKLSFDTYKLETIKWCINECKKYPLIEEILWNDVSGCYQDGVIEILSNHTNLHYVLCHNKVKNRTEVLNHTRMVDDILPSEFLLELITFFKQAEQYCIQHAVMDRVIFDPAFGFAKNREQNLYLCENTDKILQEFPQHDFMLGISKKSFLREKNTSIFDAGQLKLTQSLEAKFFHDVKKKMSSSQQQIYVRSHSLSLLESLIAINN